MSSRPFLALGLLLAALAAGCGQEEQALIPESRASELTAAVDEIQQACADQDPDAARAAVTAANQQVSELPRRVDAELKRNIRDWLNHIDDRVDRDCEPQEEEETPTPTPTPSPTETPTPEPTETPTPEPTETPTPEPTEVPPEPTVEPPGEGGVPAPEDTG
jgi:outer membrane biosynthesis protein TonB